METLKLLLTGRLSLNFLPFVSFLFLFLAVVLTGSLNYFLYIVPKILTATLQLGLELYLVVLAVSLIKREDTKTFLKRTALFFSVYFGFQLLLAGYFAVKCKAAATCSPIDFASLERPLWSLVHRIDELIPLSGWKAFSVIYEVIWSVSATLFFLMAVYGKPSLRARRIAVVFLLYSTSAILLRPVSGLLLRLVFVGDSSSDRSLADARELPARHSSPAGRRNVLPCLSYRLFSLPARSLGLLPEKRVSKPFDGAFVLDYGSSGRSFGISLLD